MGWVRIGPGNDKFSFMYEPGLITEIRDLRHVCLGFT